MDLVRSMPRVKSLNIFIKWWLPPDRAAMVSQICSLQTRVILCDIHVYAAAEVLGRSRPKSTHLSRSLGN
jgi:hypothetical protein